MDPSSRVCLGFREAERVWTPKPGLRITGFFW